MTKKELLEHLQDIEWNNFEVKRICEMGIGREDTKKIGISRSAIQKHVDNLRTKGIICRDEAGKNGKLVVINRIK
jgi:hypothetical protein